MNPYDKLMARRCNRRGHDWFPGNGPRQFIATGDICLRCQTKRVWLPYGTCLTGHPLAEHYDMQGHLTPHPTCEGPQ